METQDELLPREHLVLEAIIRNYVFKAEPTGSRFLSKREFEMSPATIRNIMSDLEDRGYISQPHTSAGRIPTDKGYKYYVEQLMQLADLPEPTRLAISEALEHPRLSDLHLLMEATSRALSRATNQLGIIIAPRLCNGVFKHVHVVNPEPNRFIMSITIDSGFVKTMVVEFESEVSRERLEAACSCINERFFGTTLEEMCAVDRDAFTNEGSLDLGVIRLLIPPIKRMMEDYKEQAVYSGETSLMLQPEFADRSDVHTIIELLEEKKMLMHLFDQPGVGKNGVIISIGGEADEGQLNRFSVVKTSYQIGHMAGELGVIGPKRMSYPLMVSAVEYTARLLGQIYK